MKTLKALLVVTLFALILTGCGEESTPPEPSEPFRTLYLTDAVYYSHNIFAVDPASGNAGATYLSPGDGPTGLAWDGTYIWVGDYTTGSLYAIDPDTHESVKTINSPGDYPGGLAWDGAYLWVADRITNVTSKITTDGSIVSSFDAVCPAAGLAWDGKNLWGSDEYNELIYKLKPANGSVLSSFPSPGGKPMGLAWDGTYLWNADEEGKCIYKIDVGTAGVVKSLAVGGFAEQPWGLAYRDDGGNR